MNADLKTYLNVFAKNTDISIYILCPLCRTGTDACLCLVVIWNNEAQANFVTSLQNKFK